MPPAVAVSVSVPTLPEILPLKSVLLFVPSRMVVARFSVREPVYSSCPAEKKSSLIVAVPDPKADTTIAFDCTGSATVLLANMNSTLLAPVFASPSVMVPVPAPAVRMV